MRAPLPPTATPPSAPSSQGSISLEPPTSFEIESRAAATPQAAPTGPSSRVQAAKPRAERRASNRIVLWDAKQLKAGPDPLGRGLALLFEKGARNSLFLAITSAPSPATDSAAAPHFVASAAIAPTERLQLWTGMKWEPSVVPELWNLFVRAGYVELSPPGASTNIKSNRNVVRAAFGVTQNEWLLLVRVGPAERCRGVLVVIAERSLLTELPQALPLLSADAPSTPIKAA